MKYLQKLVFTLFCLMCFTNNYAQQATPYFTNNNDQKYITYLINSGKLKLDHPLCQPYTYEELNKALPKKQTEYDKHWCDNIYQQTDKISSIDTSYGSAYLEGAAFGHMNYNENKTTSDLSLNPALGYFYKNFGMFYRLDANTAYLKDTLYFGSIGKMLEKNFARASDAWIQLDGKHTRIFAGRMSRNYGIPLIQGLLISNNPFSYDHLAFEAFNHNLKFTYFVTRLEDINGYDIRDSVPVHTLSKRFLTFHRLDFAIGKKLQMAISEAILFGGKDNFPMFQYLNPLNVYFLSKMSDRKNYQEGSANALMCIDLFFKPIKKISIYGQFLVDDIDFKKSLSDTFPNRLGFLGEIVYSDPFPGTQIYLNYNRINNWTYNSFYTWGNYTFYGKSLGNAMNKLESITLGMDIFRYSPFIISLDIKHSRFRKQDMESPFIAIKTNFPIGIAEQITSTGFELVYYPTYNIHISIGADYGYYKNYNHISANNKCMPSVFCKLSLIDIKSLKY